MVGKRIVVASSKGGVGKSTVSCGLAVALAKLGHRVLLVDCDFGNRCLDVMLEVEDSIVYNIGDVMSGKADPADALVRMPDFGELYFVPAPPCLTDRPVIDGIGDALRSLEEAADAEYVICDSSSGVTMPMAIAREFADNALIVASQLPTSLRAAENLASMLDSLGKLDLIRLVVSSFDADGAASGDKSGIIGLIMKSSVRLIGVVPYDYLLTVSPLPPKNKRKAAKSFAFTSFSSIAKRITGEDVPLFDGIKPLRRRLTL